MFNRLASPGQVTRGDGTGKRLQCSSAHHDQAPHSQLTLTLSLIIHVMVGCQGDTSSVIVCGVGGGATGDRNTTQQWTLASVECTATMDVKLM